MMLFASYYENQISKFLESIKFRQYRVWHQHNAPPPAPMFCTWHYRTLQQALSCMQAHGSFSEGIKTNTGVLCEPDPALVLSKCQILTHCKTEAIQTLCLCRAKLQFQVNIIS